MKRNGQRSFGPAGKRHAARPAAPRLEPLEARRLLVGCTWSVSTTSDDFDGDFAAGDLSLREAIGLANAQAGRETICLPAGDYLLTRHGAGDDLNETGDLDLIDAAGLVLLADGTGETRVGGDGADRVLHVRQGDFEAQGLTIVNGLADLGGGLMAEAGSATVTLREVVLDGNVATFAGGGVYLEPGSDLVADATVFRWNTSANLGGAISTNTGFSDGIRNRITVRSSEFSRNHATEEGGSIAALNAEVTILGSQFLENSANGLGGALFLGSESSLILGATHFEGNRARISGGGLAVVQSSTADLIAASFAMNSANLGGGVYVEASTAELLRTVVQNNTAMLGAGLALHQASALVRLVSSQVLNNFADDAGGGVQNVEGTLLTVGTTLAGNEARRSGGAIDNRGGRVELEATLLENNVAGGANSDLPPELRPEVATGGGISHANLGPRGATLVLRQGTLGNNVAQGVGSTTAKAWGGAVYSTADAGAAVRVEVLDSTLEENQAQALRTLPELSDPHLAAGGAIYSRATGGGSTTVLVERSRLSSNRAATASGLSGDAAGGAVHSSAEGADSRAAVLVVESTLEANSADTELFLGVPSPLPGEVILDPDTTSTARGGAIFNAAGPAQATGAPPAAELTVRHSTLSANQTRSSANLINLTQGGAIWNDLLDVEAGTGDAQATIISSTISGNTTQTNNDDCAYSYGGGVYNGHGTRAAGPRLSLLHSTVTGNFANAFGSTLSEAMGGGVSTWIAEVGVADAAQVGHSIIAGNFSRAQETLIPRLDVSGDFLSLGYNLIGSREVSTGFGAPGDQVGDLSHPIDPRLSPLGNHGGPTHTHLPLAGSPAVDAGDPDFDPQSLSPPLVSDQRGLPRVVSSPLLDGLPKIDLGAVEIQGARVVTRHAFYNNSQRDGSDTSANSFDDFAIAIDKSALLPGQTASFANYTSYSRGINGLMIDVAELPRVPTAADFLFRVGNNNAPHTWGDAPPPTSITVRGVEGGVNRVTITWPDGAIKKQWLQVSLLPTATTALAAADVFYFGNAVGETGNSPLQALVNAADEIGTRINPRSLANPAPVDFRFDFNRDGLVNATDQLLARINVTTSLTALALIAPGGGGGGALAEAALADLPGAGPPPGGGLLERRAKALGRPGPR